MDCQHVRWSMRMKHIAAVIVVTAVLLFTQTYTSARGAEYKIPQKIPFRAIHPHLLLAFAAQRGDLQQTSSAIHGYSMIARSSSILIS